MRRILYWLWLMVVLFEFWLISAANQLGEFDGLVGRVYYV